MHDRQVVHRSDSFHHQREQLSQQLMVRTRRGQFSIVRRAMAADSLPLVELLYRLNQ